jgi:hypothetical protein
VTHDGSFGGPPMDTGLIIFSSIIVLGIVAIVAMYFGRNFRGAVGPDGAKLETVDKK